MKKQTFLIIATLALTVTLAIWLSITLMKSFVVLPNLPQPTQRTVKVSDIVGKWKYSSRLLSYEITIEFQPDGKFFQVIIPSDDDDGIQNIGRWRLNGSDIIMEDVLIGIEEGKPFHASVNWWIVDGRMREDTDAFIVFGGDSLDEHHWEHFVRLLEEKPSEE